MSTVTLAKSFTEQLQDQMTYTPAKGHLLISDGDPNLLARLDDAFPQSLLLDCPQASWQLDSNGGLLDAIIYANDEEVTDFILAGDSLAFSSTDPDADYEDASEIFDRAKIAFAARFAAQDHFSDQIKALISHPQIAQRIEAGSLTIKAIFYRAEADVFMVYQPEKSKFEMLA